MNQRDENQVDDTPEPDDAPLRSQPPPRDAPRRALARSLILETLAAGPQPAEVVIAAATAAGLSRATLYLAPRALGIQPGGRHLQPWQLGAAVPETRAEIAERVIRAALAQGPAAGVEIYAACAAAGASRPTAFKVAQRIGVRLERGAGNHCRWELPGPVPEAPTPRLALHSAAVAKLADAVRARLSVRGMDLREVLELAHEFGVTHPAETVGHLLEASVAAGLLALQADRHGRPVAVWLTARGRAEVEDQAHGSPIASSREPTEAAAARRAAARTAPKGKGGRPRRSPAPTAP